jgi:hypothetical protein
MSEDTMSFPGGGLSRFDFASILAEAEKRKKFFFFYLDSCASGAYISMGVDDLLEMPRIMRSATLNRVIASYGEGKLFSTGEVAWPFKYVSGITATQNTSDAYYGAKVVIDGDHAVLLGTEMSDALLNGWSGVSGVKPDGFFFQANRSTSLNELSGRLWPKARVFSASQVSLGSVAGAGLSANGSVYVRSPAWRGWRKGSKGCVNVTGGRPSKCNFTGKEALLNYTKSPSRTGNGEVEGRKCDPGDLPLEEVLDSMNLYALEPLTYLPGNMSDPEVADFVKWARNELTASFRCRAQVQGLEDGSLSRVASALKLGRKEAESLLKTGIWDIQSSLKQRR